MHHIYIYINSHVKKELYEAIHVSLSCSDIFASICWCGNCFDSDGFEQKKKKKKIRKLRLESRALVNWDIIKGRDIALKIVKSDNSLLFNLRIRSKFMPNFRLFLFKS